MLALVNMPIWIKSHTLSSTHMQALVFFHVCTHTLKRISDSCHLQERSGEKSGTAESLSHVSLAQTITDNHKRVIQYTQRGNKKHLKGLQIISITCEHVSIHEHIFFSPSLVESQSNLYALFCVLLKIKSSKQQMLLLSL